MSRYFAYRTWLRHFVLVLIHLAGLMSIVASGGGGGGSGNQSPTAGFTLNADTGATPFRVRLDASESRDPDGTITRYVWDFGDGTTAEGATVTHIFHTQGTHRIRLRVYDDDGAEAEHSAEVTVIGPPILFPVNPVTDAQTVAIHGVAFPGAELEIENRVTGEQHRLTDDDGIFEASLGLEPGINRIFVTARIRGVNGAPAELEIIRAPVQRITLDAMTPGSAMAGSIVTLTGAGFGTRPGRVQVYFRARLLEEAVENLPAELDFPASVVEATDTRLRVIVPFPLLQAGSADVYVRVGDAVSNAVTVAIEELADPNPGRNDTDETLARLAAQLDTLKRVFDGLVPAHMPEATKARLSGNIAQARSLVATFRSRLAGIPNEQVRNRIDAILGSEGLQDALARLDDITQRLAALGSSGAVSGIVMAADAGGDSGIDNCNMAEVIQQLRDVMAPFHTINDALNHTIDMLYGSLVASSVGCFFGIVPACVAIPFLLDTIAVVSAVHSVVNAIVQVEEMVVAVLEGTTPTYPSEWKLVLQQPIPNLANDVIYTQSENSLSLYANFVNAPLAEFVEDRDIRVDIPDPFGVMSIVETITGFDIREALGDLIASAALTIVADIAGIETGTLTDMDQLVPSRVTLLEGQGLVELPDGIGARTSHRLLAGAGVGNVVIDIRGSCGAYRYPDQTRCEAFHEDGSCRTWSTDYPQTHAIEVLDKPRIDRISDWTETVHLEPGVWHSCTYRGANICSKEEYQSYLSQICKSLTGEAATQTCRSYETFSRLCYDPETRQDRCTADDFRPYLEAFCPEAVNQPGDVDNKALCEQVINKTITIQYQTGYWHVSGKGFSSSGTRLDWNRSLEYVPPGALGMSAFRLYAYYLFGRIKPGWLRVFVGSGEAQRISDPVFVEPSPNFVPELIGINPVLYPGDSLYLAGNYFTTIANDLVLTVPAQGLNWPASAVSTGGFQSMGEVARFREPARSLAAGSHAFHVSTGPAPTCPGSRCAEGNVTVLPVTRADTGADLHVAGPYAFAVPRAVALGDFNGDGVPDLAVGLPSSRPFGASVGASSGAVALLFGPLDTDGDGLIDLKSVDQWDVQILGDDRDIDNASGNIRRIGNALAAGDIDGDGIDDLVIGSTDQNEEGRHGPYHGDPTGPQSHLPGKAYVLFGRNAWNATYRFTLDEYDVRFTATDDRELGKTVAVGHLGTTSGPMDLVLGAPSRPYVAGDNPGAGQIVIVRGGALDGTIGDVQVPGNLVSVFGLDAGMISGVVESFTSVVSFTDGTTATHWSDRLGEALAVADVNGDGLDDLIVGAPGLTRIESANPLTEREGAVYVFHGRPWDGPADNTLSLLGHGGPFVLDALASGDQALALLGFPVAADTARSGFGQAVHAADLTGDGRAELVVGAPNAVLQMAFYVYGSETPELNLEEVSAGRIYLLDGANPAWDSAATANVDEVADLAVYGSSNFRRFGYSLASTDMDQDGETELFVGAPGIRYSRGKVWVMRGTGTPWWEMTAYQDDIHLETRTWAARMPVPRISASNTAIPDDLDFVFEAGRDNDSVFPTFGTALLTGELVSPAANDLLIVDAGGDVPDTAEPGGLRHGAGSVEIFHGDYFVAHPGDLNMPPRIGSEPASLDFGTLLMGGQQERIIRIRNQTLARSSTLEISDIRIAGNAGFALVDPPTLPLPLDAGEERVLTLHFTAPATAGAQTDELVIESNDPVNSMLRIPLQATVTGEMAVLHVPDSIMIPGRENSATLIIENPGNAALAWQIDTSGWPSWITANPATGTTAPGGSSAVTLGVSRAGLDAGTRHVLLTLTSNDPNRPTVTVDVAVEILPEPDIRLIPDSLAFDIEPGWSVTRAVRILNVGAAPLEISGGTLAGDDFYLWNPSDACGGTLQPLASCSIGIGFQRHTEGISEGALAIHSNDPDRPTAVVSITGTASIRLAPRISVIGINPVFMEVPIGTLETQDILIRNTGGSELQITGVTVTGDPAFSLVANECGEPLPVYTGLPSQMCRVRVGFTPTTTAPVYGQITIESTDPENAVLQGNLSGYAITPFTQIAPDVLDFGENISTHFLTIENTSSVNTLEWRIIDPLPDWLQIDYTSGALAPMTQATLTLTVDRSGLDSATYEQVLRFDTNGGDASVTVRMTVVQPTAQLTTYARTFGGADNDEFSSVRATTDGGFIAAGRTRSFGAGNTDAWIVKFDDSGNVQWQKTYGGDNDDRAYTIIPLTSSGYAVVGGTWSWYNSTEPWYQWYGLWVWRLDDNGNILWQKILGGHIQDYDDRWDILETGTGDLIIAGMRQDASDMDTWILRLREDTGDIVWQTKLINNGDQQLFGLAPAPDDGLVVTGMTCDEVTSNCDVLVAMLGADGTLIWQKAYGGDGYDHGWSVTADADGNYVVTGLTTSFTTGLDSLWLLKLDSNGNILWQKSAGPVEGNAEGFSVQTLADGSYAVAGRLWVNGQEDGWILRVAANGELIASRTYGLDGNENLYALQPLPNGDILAAGSIASRGAGLFDALLLKVDTIGNIGQLCDLAGYFDITLEETTATVSDPGLTAGLILGPPSMDTSATMTDATASETTQCSETPEQASQRPVVDIDVSPTVLDFGSVPVELTQSQTVTVRNTGYADLNLSPPYLSPVLANFGLDTTCLDRLKPTLACDVLVSFTPLSTDVQTTNLYIESNDPDESPFVVPITGQGSTGGGDGGGGLVPVPVPGG